MKWLQPVFFHMVVIIATQKCVGNNSFKVKPKDSFPLRSV